MEPSNPKFKFLIHNNFRPNIGDVLNFVMREHTLTETNVWQRHWGIKRKPHWTPFLAPFSHWLILIWKWIAIWLHSAVRVKNDWIEMIRQSHHNKLLSLSPLQLIISYNTLHYYIRHTLYLLSTAFMAFFLEAYSISSMKSPISGWIYVMNNSTISEDMGSLVVPYFLSLVNVDKVQWRCSDTWAFLWVFSNFHRFFG